MSYTVRKCYLRICVELLRSQEISLSMHTKVQQLEFEQKDLHEARRRAEEARLLAEEAANMEKAEKERRVNKFSVSLNLDNSFIVYYKQLKCVMFRNNFIHRINCEVVFVPTSNITSLCVEIIVFQCFCNINCSNKYTFFVAYTRSASCFVALSFVI